MDDNYPEVLFAIQNDFDSIPSNISNNQPKIPEMINIIGKDAFENDQESLDEANKEIQNIFLNEGYQYFFHHPKVEEKKSKEIHTSVFPNLQTKKNDINKTRNQFEEKSQNEIIQIFPDKIDDFSHHGKQKKIHYPLQSFPQNKLKSFNISNFYSFLQ